MENKSINNSEIDYSQLVEKIKRWAFDAGFQQTGITDINLSDYEAKFNQWINKQFHGEMHYMERHGSKRYRPAELVPGTVRVISVRMDYFPPETKEAWSVINESKLAYISRYALGRDYHKLMRKKLQAVAKKIEAETGSTGYRVFVDSAPVMEKALAEKAGLGWIGKHTNVLNRETGSWFFLGEIYTDLPLPIDTPQTDHCGECTRCIDICPTQAIIGPGELDATKCISYLTIELRGSIPETLRPQMGNRIYGCDDCQLICPWNRFAQLSEQADFSARHQLDAPELLDLFSWSEKEFLEKMEGSAIRRIGYECWQRNIAVALGNADKNKIIIQSLTEKRKTASAMVQEHIDWAIKQQTI